MKRELSFNPHSRLRRSARPHIDDANSCPFLSKLGDCGGITVGRLPPPACDYFILPPRTSYEDQFGLPAPWHSTSSRAADIASNARVRAQQKLLQKQHTNLAEPQGRNTGRPTSQHQRLLLSPSPLANLRHCPDCRSDLGPSIKP